MNIHNLFQMVQNPIRKNRLLDTFITNDNRAQILNVITAGISDHHFIYGTFPIKVDKIRYDEIKFRNYKSIDINDLNNKVTGYDYNILEQTEDVNLVYDKICNLMK